MTYCIKCKECDYRDSVTMPGWTAYEKYRDETECPKCGSAIETDVAEQGKEMRFTMNGMKGIGKKNDRLERATARQKNKKMDETRTKKDPYWKFRDKGDPRKVF